MAGDVSSRFVTSLQYVPLEGVPLTPSLFVGFVCDPCVSRSDSSQMTWAMLSQLSPIVFLQSEFYGCTLRAGAIDITSSNKTSFSIVSLDNGDYCGKIRTGTRALSFQIVVMLYVAWATGGNDKRVAQNAKLSNRVSSDSVNTTTMPAFLTRLILSLCKIALRSSQSLVLETAAGR